MDHISDGSLYGSRVTLLDLDPVPALSNDLYCHRGQLISVTTEIG